MLPDIRPNNEVITLNLQLNIDSYLSLTSFYAARGLTFLWQMTKYACN